ncbi:MAG: CHAT domain-containing tetratricopeptide repeat protein [Burkholderiales bacterium]|nr:CHAT domain-containing tetratricopeptide repeat protein [Burkholderiales bacterium]
MSVSTQCCNASKWILIGCLVLCANPASAQGDELSKLNASAAELLRTGKYAQGIEVAEKALALAERVFDPIHPKVALTISNLAGLYQAQGQYAKAEPLFARALAISEKVWGAEHRNVTGSLNNLGNVYVALGQYAKAEPLYVRGLAIREKMLGAEHAEVALSLNNLGRMYASQGQYAKAELHFERALAIREKHLGAEHRDVASSINELAGLYFAQGQYAKAEPFYVRALSIREKVLGAEHPSVASSLNNLADLYHAQRQYAKAEPLYARALAMGEKAWGAEHPYVATILNNLAGLYREQGQYARAEPLYARSLAIGEKVLGAEHPNVATSLNNLALLHQAQGRYAKAEQLYGRALAIREKVLGAEHPSVAASLHNLSILHRKQGRDSEALSMVRRSTTIMRRRFVDAAPGRAGTAETGQLSELHARRRVLVGHVELVHRYALVANLTDAASSSEAFEIAQLARASDTGAVLGQMAARFGAGDSDLAQLVRARQDGAARLRALDAKLVAAISRPADRRDSALTDQVRKDIAAAQSSLDAIDTTLNQRFPDYQVLVSKSPLMLPEAQALLEPKEALLSYLISEKESYLWVVRRDRQAFIKLDLGKEALDQRVKVLRRALEDSRVVPYPVVAAQELHQFIFAPALPYLDGVTSLLIVADGALQSLPFGVLVGAKYGGDPLVPIYRNVDWLAKRYAMTTLPSEASLKALRKFSGTAAAPEPFLGFGDPVFDGGSTGAVGSANRNFASLFKSRGVADVTELAKLERLPETADEVLGMAKAFGAGQQFVRLREQATEAQVKQMDLTRYRTLAFSTHGIVAGEMKGVVEPALVLTPPKTATELDDGLLTASEITQLKLNADWVILSACNTAATDGTPGAEGFSGLARAFLYAGSRSMLVSHWPVESLATMQLVGDTVRFVSEDAKLGRAEALQKAMLALMADKANPVRAHPFFWAPFVVVGEGRR